MSMTASTEQVLPPASSSRSERLRHAGVTSSSSTRRSMRPGALPPLKPPGVCDCVCVGVGQSLIDDGVSAGRQDGDDAVRRRQRRRRHAVVHLVGGGEQTGHAAGLRRAPQVVDLAAELVVLAAEVVVLGRERGPGRGRGRVAPRLDRRGARAHVAPSVAAAVRPGGASRGRGVGGTGGAASVVPGGAASAEPRAVAPAAPGAAASGGWRGRHCSLLWIMWFRK